MGSAEGEEWHEEIIKRGSKQKVDLGGGTRRSSKIKD